MKRLYVFLLTLLICSCAPKLISVKGTYLKEPYQITTADSFGTVWDKLIDLFAEKGLPIKIIDRSSGLIVSERSVISKTTELKNGSLKNPNAFIVVPQLYDAGSRKTSPFTGYSDVTGEWNVRIRQANGQT